MSRLLPVLALLGAAACVSTGPGEAVDLPPPCPPEVAARVPADGAGIRAPRLDRLAMPPQRPSGTAAGTHDITLTIGADGRVVPGTVRVTGPDAPGYVERLVRWVEQLRFHPATFQGCAVQRQTEMRVTG